MTRIRFALYQLLPAGFVEADRLTTSAKRFFRYAAVSAIAGVGGLVALGLLDSTNWRDVLSGALLAWAVSGVGWAGSAYRRGREGTRTDLRRVSELDLLHARLNHLALRLNAPTVGLSWEIEHVLEARRERLAHFAGLEEFRPPGEMPGALWWDTEAISDPTTG
jgi:hypothetical protein